MMASSTALVVMSLLVVGRVVFPLRVFKSNNQLITRSGSNSVLRAAGLSSTGTAAAMISLPDEDLDSTIKKITFSPFTFDTSPVNAYLPDLDLMATVPSPVKKQTLLYLPGLDGSGNFSSKSFANLTDRYDCWRMAVDPSDRSSFLVVAQKVLRRLTEFDGPVVLVGESFGGLLASYVCTREGANVDKLVLINPATSFDRTAWSTIVPFIAGTGNAYPLVGATALLATAVQPQQVVNIGRDISSRIDSVDSALTQLNGMWKSVQSIIEVLPPQTLQFRVRNLLGVGSYLMRDRYQLIKTPTLVVTGGSDRLLPSRDEGRRLKRKMSGAPEVDIRSFRDRGHAILDGTLDLADIMRRSKVFKSDLGSAYESFLPSQMELKEIQPLIDRFYQATSPIYFSRNSKGDLMRGLDSVPTGLEGRPVLLVGNHQLLGLDLPLIVYEFLKQKNTLIRGLTHPSLFSNASNGNDGTRDLFVKFGAVPVSPISIYELMKINSTVLLFPGGVREAFHGKNERYQLFWPEKTDFVRMATMMDALIVPFAAVGMAESLTTIADVDDAMKIPFLRRRIEDSIQFVPQARAGGRQSFTPPLVAPRLPSRNYFLFQEAFDTREISMKNKTQCFTAYKQIEGRLEEGLTTLRTIQARDRYRDFIPRLLYERVRRSQAPTAPFEDL